MNVIKLAVFGVVACLLFLPAVAGAQGGLDSQVQKFDGTVGGNDLVNAIRSIVNWLLALAGIVAVIYLIYGGVKYIISAGDTGKADEAKNTILYAIIGLIVIGLSVVVVNFILNAIASAG